MNQDLAFIDHLQAHPGDDFCRLAYCDYLDEHSDLRGVYLRDELALMQTYEAGHDWRAGLEALKHLRPQVDPQWLSKVGIRCDVRLHDYPRERMIGTMKIVRELTGLGLKDISDLIYSHRLIRPDENLVDALRLQRRFEHASAPWGVGKIVVRVSRLRERLA